MNKKLTLEQRVARIEKAVQENLVFTQPTQPVQQRYAIWENRLGIQLFPEDMEDVYILNTISLIESIEKKKFYLYRLRNEAKRRGLL